MEFYHMKYFISMITFIFANNTKYSFEKLKAWISANKSAKLMENSIENWIWTPILMGIMRWYGYEQGSSIKVVRYKSNIRKSITQS